MAKIAVIGIGNILFGDDGVGVFAIKFLQENYLFFPFVDLIDGQTLGFGLMEYFQDYDHLLILDTVSINDQPGSIFRLPSETLLGLGTYQKTAHEVEVVEMLEICSLLEKTASVIVFGIVPEDIQSMGVGLSKTLLKRFEALITAVLGELETLGISYTRKSNTSLEDVISKTLIER